jgi:hypothetical protein
VRAPAGIRWLGLGLLGILIAAGVSVAASSLASRQIGLSSEPISAGEALAPAATQAKPRARAEHRRQKHRHPRTTTTPTSPPAGTPAQTNEGPPASPTLPEPPGNRSDTEHSDGGGGADD